MPKTMDEHTNAGWISDPEEAKTILIHANDVKSQYTESHNALKTYEDAYLGKWDEGNKVKAARTGAKIVQSPDARNEVLGAVGLMIGTDPTFSIEDVLDPPSGFDKDKLETSLKKWWEYAGRLKRRPIHYDIVLSAILYGEMHTSINPMRDIITRMERAGGKKSKGILKRIERIKRAELITPILLESWSPMNGYPETDQYGLSGYLREITTSPDAVRATFADILPEGWTKKGATKTCTLSTWTDLDWVCIWVDGELIFMQPMPYTDIPIDFTLTGTGGSELFEKKEDQRQPLLYTMMKHGLYNAQNLMMTVLYTTVFSVGISAMLKHVAPESNPDKKLQLNFDEVLGIAELEKTEEVEFMDTGKVITSAFQDAYKLAEQKGYESTIYPQAFGAAIGRNTTFSEMSLLGQAGRLPLIGTQRMGSEGISHIVELALMTIRETKYKYKSNEIEFDPMAIPKNIMVRTNLDVKLAQDQLQLANVASMLQKAGLADKTWIQENIMNMQDYKGMQKRIWNQQAADIMFSKWLEQQIKQMEPPPPTPAELPGVKTAATPGEIMPPEMEPTQTPPGMEPGAAQAGQVEGLPGAQAGMVPGAGQGSSVPADMQEII